MIRFADIQTTLVPSQGAVRGLIRFASGLLLTIATAHFALATAAEEGAVRVVQEDRPVTPQQLQVALSVPAVSMSGAVIQSAPLVTLYRLRGFEPIFVDDNGLNHQAKALKFDVIDKAAYRGLQPKDYRQQAIEARWTSPDPARLFELELLLADAYIKIASDASTGRIPPSQIDPDLVFKKRNFARYDMLIFLNDRSLVLDEGLASLEPQNRHYQQLKKFLARVLKLERQHGWAPIRFSEDLRPGMSHEAIPAVRARLVDFGYLPEQERANSSTLYDHNLSQAVLRFQFNMKLGFSPDSGLPVIGAATRRILNMSSTELISQININLEKLRWLPEELGQRHAFVNVARQELKVYEGDKVPLKMNVVVGKDARRTPSMGDRLVSVTLNPYWNPPPRNIIEDIVPAIRNDRSYLTNARMKVFDGSRLLDPALVDWADYNHKKQGYLFRQEPGPFNSLGIVRFDLANGRAIYLHGSSQAPKALALFKNLNRYNSSGCIRLEDPRAFLDYLMPSLRIDPKSPDFETIFAQPEKYRAVPVKMAKSLPVYLVNLTAGVDEQGLLQLSPDNYGQDRQIGMELLMRSAQINPY